MIPSAPCDISDEDPTKAHPPGALRAFSRVLAGSTLLAITASEDFLEDAEDKFVGIWWVSTPEAAQRVEAAVMELLAAARFHVNAQGFSSFPASKVGNLVGQAMLHAAVETKHPPTLMQEKTWRPWSRERIARLAFLIGAGWEAKDIADDPEIDTTPSNVQRQASRLGLSFMEAPRERLSARVKREYIVRFDRLAAATNLTSEALLRRMIIAAPKLVPLIEGSVRSDSVSL